jgi:outer membrane immunogenic protein
MGAGMIRRFVLTSVSGIALTAAASAADMYFPGLGGGSKDGPAYVAPWAGWYAGVNGGGAWTGNSDMFAEPVVQFSGIGPSGGFGGGQIGYNWQGVWHPNLVLGAEADIQGAGIDDIGVNRVGSIFKSRLDFFGTVRGRLGLAFGSSLLYATGGFAYGGIENEILSASHQDFKVSNTATGYTVGGGYEYKVSPALSLKAEYQYINLGRNDPVLLGVTPCPPVKCEDDAFHTIRAGINYHFGQHYEPLK